MHEAAEHYCRFSKFSASALLAVNALSSPSLGLPCCVHGPNRPIPAQHHCGTARVETLQPLSCWICCCPDQAGGTQGLCHGSLGLWPFPVLSLFFAQTVQTLQDSAHCAQSLQDRTQMERAEPVLVAALAPGWAPVHGSVLLLLCHDNAEPQRATKLGCFSNIIRRLYLLPFFLSL